MLIDEETLARRVASLAAELHARCPPDAPLLLLGLLDGSFVFLADLARALARRGLDPRVELARTSLYGGAREASRDVAVLHDSREPLTGVAVVLVDDILDTGRTLATMVERTRARDPLWLASCVLLDKPARRQVKIAADFTGFEVPDAWVLGYGLDHAGAGRGLPYVAVLDS